MIYVIAKTLVKIKTPATIIYDMIISDIIIITIILVFEYYSSSNAIGKIFVILLPIYLILNQITTLYVHIKNRIVERDFQRYVEVFAEQSRPKD